MKSKSFNFFLNQLHKKGREYGDGFSPHCFEGMTEEESEEAKAELQKRVMKGDIIALQGLILLCKGKKREYLLELYQLIDNSTVIGSILAAELYRTENSSEYIDVLLKNLIFGDKSNQWITLQELANINYCNHWNLKIKSVFEKIILEDKDKVKKHIAAQKLLKEKNIFPDSELYKYFIKKIINDDKKIQQYTLQEINNF